MNIKACAGQVTDRGPQPESLYRTVPRWREILASVRAGRVEFEDVLAKTGLLEEFGIATSNVHPYQDIEIQAFILGIVSGDRWDEIQTKSYLTYASHWIDDFFDSPERVASPAQLRADRGDIRRALANMGPPGTVGFAMANRVRHPKAVYKSLQRMLYGGLVQRARNCAERHILVIEYQTVATQFVDRGLVDRIRQLQPEAYWTTNKTVQELLYAAEKEVDFNTAELWNLIYAPALYFADAEEERSRGELNFEERETPRLAEMVKMIQLGAESLGRMYDKHSLYFRQLEFAAISIPNLPGSVLEAYRSLWEGGAANIPMA